MPKHTYYYKDGNGEARLSEVLTVFKDYSDGGQDLAVIRRRKGLYEVGEPYEVVRVHNSQVNDDLSIDMFQEGFHRD